MTDSPENKPLTLRQGAACVGCKKRKLKCSREQDGCSNCLKADLPCVYPSPGPAKKRGPYKKDKPARERHLEDVLRYLEPLKQTRHGNVNSNLKIGDASSSSSVIHQSDATEHLVKDALKALTSANAPERDDEYTDGEADNSRQIGMQYTQDDSPMAISSDLLDQTWLHPRAEHIFCLWQIFMSRVDPLTKIIHCPSVGLKLMKAVSTPAAIRGTDFEALMFSIYFCAIMAAEPHELRAYFGEDQQQQLILRYGQAIETSLAEKCERPSLETIQALVLYLMGCRRKVIVSNLHTLFVLAVHSARMLGLDQDPKISEYSPYEAEMRRRIWWQLARLESYGAEEGGVRSTSVSEATKVGLPKNLNDIDLDPQAVKPPIARQGITDMTYVLCHLSNVQLIFELRKIRKTYAETGNAALAAARLEQREMYERYETLHRRQYYDYMDETRPYDWLCLTLSQAMLLKGRMLIDHPFSNGPPITMSESDRLRLLQDSVNIIRSTQNMATDERVKRWRWFVRGYTQWHAIAVVVTELSQSRNPQFMQEAWVVLDQVLEGWSAMYHTKRNEPAWDHVNTIIERAKHVRALQAQVSLVSTSNRQGAHQSLSPLSQDSKAQVQYDVRAQQEFVNDGNSAEAVYANAETDLTGLDWVDDMNDMLHDIDFSAFGTVFENEVWELPRVDDNDSLRPEA